MAETDIVCISPVDGSEFARRALISTEGLAAVLDRARAAQRIWARTPLVERHAAMARFLEALSAANDEIVPELAWQMGRPVRYGGELRGLKERITHSIALASSALEPVRPMDFSADRPRYVKRLPLGIVLVVAPWNYPYLTATNAIVPALLAGNAVILKHASQTILAGERLAAAMAVAGLPDGLFANVVLSHSQTNALIGSGQIDHVNFTGSVQGGQAIAAATGNTFTSLGLELGGKDPAYVRADAALAPTVAALVDGSFYNSGQCCCGIERIYVAREIYSDFVEAFVAETKNYALGNPLDSGTTLGPMANRRVASIVRTQTAAAIAAGARALIDEKLFAASAAGTPYLAPQVLVDVNHSMDVMSEESFGPVVGIMPVESDAAAVAMMNDSQYGLTASIWTNDLEAAERLGDEIDTGTLFVNRCDYVDPGLAWTGIKNSGRGASLSRVGFETLTRPKSFHIAKLA